MLISIRFEKALDKILHTFGTIVKDCSNLNDEDPIKKLENMSDSISKIEKDIDLNQLNNWLRILERDIYTNQCYKVLVLDQIERLFQENEQKFKTTCANPEQATKLLLEGKREMIRIICIIRTTPFSENI